MKFLKSFDPATKHQLSENIGQTDQRIATEQSTDQVATLRPVQIRTRLQRCDRSTRIRSERCDRSTHGPGRNVATGPHGLSRNVATGPRTNQVVTFRRVHTNQVAMLRPVHARTRSRFNDWTVPNINQRVKSPRHESVHSRLNSLILSSTGHDNSISHSR
ncbi:hypothetical protein DY000_02021350 [Brassica cretica]|uniref:Uncharacterized protein n=1 Tax=Brassica cretica TaxID=69181 RepID=A0ABQ7EMD3_BRACR|nr:hypothetical protein DY000_02021350 [Brassica cretica]